MLSFYCTTHKKLQELLQDPEFRKQFEEEQAQFRNEEITYRKSARKRGTVYTIPVVFHVLHSGGVENISDEQIYDCITDAIEYYTKWILTNTT